MSALPPTSAVLVAAGASTRLAARARKPLLELAGKSVLARACSAFEACAAVREIVIVGHEEDLARIKELAARKELGKKVRAIVPGGEQRADSVRRGLAACDSGSELVAVHDAARPLVTLAIVERALAEAARSGAALVALPVADTLKRSPDGRAADSTVERAGVWRAQTPQVFRLAELRSLAERAADEGWRPSDESALYERYRGPVPLVLGSAENFKLTTPEDLELAEALLSLRAERPR